MGKFKELSLLAILLSTLFMQGCMLAPTIPDPQMQQSAVERWNRCVQRYNDKPEHYCDGHRRDIIATYPSHLENQINSLLSQRLRTKRASQLVKTGLESAPIASEYNLSETLTERLGTAN